MRSILPTEIRVGWILRYTDLWDWQYRESRDMGDKDRPCPVLGSGWRAGRPRPAYRITHTPPANPAEAIEIPGVTNPRLGSDEARSWIVLTESNRFAWPRPDLWALLLWTR